MLAPPAHTTEVQRLAYSPTELAEVLGASRAWVYVHMDNGTIPSVKLGGRRFIRAAVVDALLSGEVPNDGA